MAITKAIPTLWSARIYEGFQRMNVWANLVTDISGQLASGGDRINLLSITSDVTVNDYQRNTDISDPELMDDASVQLLIDQLKYFNIYVDDVDRVQALPALMDHFSLQAGRQIAKTYDEYVYGLFTGGNLSSSDPKAELRTAIALPANADAPTSTELALLVTTCLLYTSPSPRD